MTIEYGIVIKFNRGQGYGFMRVLDENGEETEETIFFHYSNGRHIDTNDGHPIFTSASNAKAPGNKVPLPKEGDRLVFRRGQGINGEKATPWGYAEDWVTTPQASAQP